MFDYQVNIHEFINVTNLLFKMAHHASKSSQPSDFDRQYEEDLERARALSLESLALEKFRLQKLELERHKSQERRPSQIEGLFHSDIRANLSGMIQYGMHRVDQGSI